MIHATVFKRRMLLVGLASAALVMAVPACMRAQIREPKIQTEVQHQERYLDIESYRPLVDALAFLSKDLNLLLSYEDPPIPDGETEDISVLSWRKDHPGERGFYVQRWSTLSTHYSVASASQVHSEASLQAVVKEYNRDHTATVFHVTRTGSRRFTIIGRLRGQQTSPLDAVVPAPASGSASAALLELAQRCSAMSGFTIETGTIPLNASELISFQATKREAESCRIWLEQLTKAFGTNSVYLLSDDITDRKFVLNIVPVRIIRDPILTR